MTQKTPVIVRGGYLKKESKTLKIFRQRWSELDNENCAIRCYKKKEGINKKPTEEIYIIRYIEHKAIMSDTDKSMFIVPTADIPIKYRKFQALSNEDANAWIAAINQAILRKSSQIFGQLSSKYGSWNESDGSKERSIYESPTVQSVCSDNMMENIQYISRNTHKRVDIEVLDATEMNIELNINIDINKSLNHFISNVIQQLNKEHYPTQFIFHHIVSKHDNKRIYNIDTKLSHLMTDILPIFALKFKWIITVKIKQFQHNIISMDITCHPLLCPIYQEMINEKGFNNKNVYHLWEYIHFKNECMDKPQCQYDDKCDSFIRLKNGGNDINDQCHIKLFKHSPRRRQIKLSENINTFLLNKNNDDDDCKDNYYPLFEPKNNIKQTTITTTKIDGYFNELMHEVIGNGYKKDLGLKEDDRYLIMNIIDDKMRSYRHKQMGLILNRGEMLALILYTGYDCHYDLCKSQRKGNYKKWRWFDYCLYNAIQKLHKMEYANYNVYIGLNATKMNEKCINNGYFETYVSTTWNKNVSLHFIKNEGMIIQIDAMYKNLENIKCCDVSWISKFPDECEIIFARTLYNDQRFKCNVIEQKDGIQTVFLNTNNN